MRLFSILLIFNIMFSSLCQSQEKKNRGIIVLGSSHAYYMNWENLKGFRKNASVPDFNSRQLALTLSYEVIENNPQICIVQTGPEDLAQGLSPEKVIQNLGKMNDELVSDSIELIILSGVQNPELKNPGNVKLFVD